MGKRAVGLIRGEVPAALLGSGGGYGSGSGYGDGDGYGYGSGSGSGSGSGDGSGSGSGDGYGSGSGDGDGDGDGSGGGSGSGYGDGYGSGYGYGDGDGDGYGSGSGSGSGYGSGSGSGSGYGYGSGDGDGGGADGVKYWRAVVSAAVAALAPDRRARADALRASGAVIAFWKSDASGCAANGGRNTPVALGTVERVTGPLRSTCGKGQLHATLAPHKWSGERWWIVALIGEVRGDDEKYWALEREVIAEFKG